MFECIIKRASKDSKEVKEETSILMLKSVNEASESPKDHADDEQ